MFPSESLTNLSGYAKRLRFQVSVQNNNVHSRQQLAHRAELLPTDLLLSRDVTVIEYKAERVNHMQRQCLVKYFSGVTATM